MVNRALPVYASVVMFVMSGICVLLLSERDGDGGKGGERTGGGTLH